MVRLLPEAGRANKFRQKPWVTTLALAPGARRRNYPAKRAVGEFARRKTETAEDAMPELDERRLHQCVSSIGLRAQATAVGLIQLTAELGRAGVLDPAAVGRVKEAIARDLMLSPPASVPKAEFETWLRRRLDALFACDEPVGRDVDIPTT
jgi:hypothetical protein